jgi:predicted CDP-diglyceride synthetase/phosphatidate cytidylyltransferase
MLRSWHGEGMAWAKASLWLDLLFIPAYLFLLIQLTRRLTKDRPGVRERTGARWVFALFLAAGLSDTAENILLLNNLDAPTDIISLSATVVALAKFTGLILGAAGLVIIRAARRHPLAND